MWCIDPSTKEIIEIPIPHSVLAGRLVCKKMKEDMGVIFWKVNDFYFGTSYMAALAIDRLPYQFAKEIRKLRFDFTSKEADQTFRELAQMCPNLKPSASIWTMWALMLMTISVNILLLIIIGNT